MSAWLDYDNWSATLCVTQNSVAAPWATTAAQNYFVSYRSMEAGSHKQQLHMHQCGCCICEYVYNMVYTCPVLLPLLPLLLLQPAMSEAVRQPYRQTPATNTADFALPMAA